MAEDGQRHPPASGRNSSLMSSFRRCADSGVLFRSLRLTRADDPANSGGANCATLPLRSVAESHEPQVPVPAPRFQTLKRHAYQNIPLPLKNKQQEAFLQVCTPSACQPLSLSLFRTIIPSAFPCFLLHFLLTVYLRNYTHASAVLTMLCRVREPGLFRNNSTRRSIEPVESILEMCILPCANTAKVFVVSQYGRTRTGVVVPTFQEGII